MRLSKPQQVSLYSKWLQNNHFMSFLKFRRTVIPYMGSSGCVMVQWCGMWLGIETDGYTHS